MRVLPSNKDTNRSHGDRTIAGQRYIIYFGDQIIGGSGLETGASAPEVFFYAFISLAPLMSNKPTPYTLRSFRPGDMGWIVHRHGVLYWQEYQWNEEFEALVAEVVAKFIQHYDPQFERCWIAERDGVILGSIFLVRHAENVGKLRLLYVEPDARGLGLGKHLVEECIAFAREVGYEKVILWTNSILHAARKIYEHFGFQLIEEERQHLFGHDLVSQTWELPL